MDIAHRIDYTLLKPDLCFEDIDVLLEQALERGYYGVCIPSFFVEYVRKKTEENDIQISTVIGFPYGFESYKSKVEEVREVVSDGAKELDVVLNVGAVKTESWKYVDSEIDSLSSMCRVKNARLKLIADHNLLTQDEIKRIVEIAVLHNVDFIKTATGRFGNTSAKDVAFLKSICGDEIKIKAAGGISSLEEAVKMIEMGADRIGASTLL